MPPSAPPEAHTERDLSYLIEERVFAGDDPVGFALAAPDEMPSWSSGSARQCWLPRGVLRRLVFLGRAYSLHTLGNVDMIHPTRMDAAKSHSLRGELEFLGSIVSDPHVAHALSLLAPLLHACESEAAFEFVVVPGGSS
ncbi:MAG: hypothetical protein ACR2PQ_06045 [Myxococcota bacterium]